MSKIWVLIIKVIMTKRKISKKKYKVSGNFSSKGKDKLTARKKLAKRLGEELFQLVGNLTQ